jgi:hypothetical protein
VTREPDAGKLARPVARLPGDDGDVDAVGLEVIVVPAQGGQDLRPSRRVRYLVFDLLYYGKRCLVREPLFRRREILAELLEFLEKHFNPFVQLLDLDRGCR